MDQVEQLKSDLETLQREVADLRNSMGVKEKKPKKPRAPSAFNIYMKEAIPRVKAASPGISHSDAFKQAANEWGAHKAL